MGERVLYEGDGILLFCEKARGFVFSSPPLLKSNISSLQFHITDQADSPRLSNVHYACFTIQPWISSTKHFFSSNPLKEPKELVYGRQVWLQHFASGWYLTFSSNKENETEVSLAHLVEKREEADSFHIMPSDTMKSIGQAIMVEDAVCLEIAPTTAKMFRVLCVPNDGGCDVRTASNGSDFILCSQSSIFANLLGDHQALRAGDVVKFRKKNCDSYLTVLENTDQDTVPVAINGCSDYEDANLIHDDNDGPIFTMGFEYNNSYFKIEPSISSTESFSSNLKRQIKLVYGRPVSLQHCVSGKYLTFNSNTGKSSSASLVVKGDADRFCILPSNSAKPTGQTIFIEDTVYLQIAPTAQNTATTGKMFKVLCSSNVRGYDIRMASDSSNFVLHSHFTVKNIHEVPSMALRGGDVVMFISGHYDAYLTILEDTDQVVCKVHDDAYKSAFTGGEDYWQIENALVQYNGNWVDQQWDVYIKHLPTQKYLCLVEDKIILKAMRKRGQKGEQNENEDAIFQLQCPDKSDSGILKGSHVLIRHKKTKYILNLNSKNLKGKCNGHHFFEATTFEENDEGDHKFWMEGVERNVLKEFSALSGAFNILEDYIEQLKQNKTECGSISPDIPFPSNIVVTLAEWSCRRSYALLEKWPDMMRVMKGVELVLKLLELEATPKWLMKKLCVVLNNYISCASEESQLYLLSKNELLMAIFLKVGLGIGAESVLSALFQCRSFGPQHKAKVLDHLLNAEIIRERIQKDFSFLQCLSSLCLCGGRPDRDIQRDLLENIIIPFHRCNQGIFFRIECTRSGVRIENPRMLKDCTDHHQLDDFLIWQIELYAAICKGVNINSIDTMVKSEKILTYAEAEKCTEQCSARVQPVFFSYLVSTLVDKNAEESGTDLENIWYIYAWNRFNDEHQSFDPVHLSAIADTHEIISDKKEMIEMQGKIHNSLDEKRWARDIEDKKEELITQRLSMLETLVAYGFYWRDDTTIVTEHETMKVPSPASVIEALVGILSYDSSKEGVDGQSELADGRTRKEVVFRLQAKAIEILRLFLHQTYHLGTARLIFDYRYFQNPPNEKLENYVIPKAGLGELLKENYKIEMPHALLGPRSHIPNDVNEALHRLRWLLYQDQFCTDQSHWQFPGYSRSCDYDYRLLNVYDGESKDLQKLLIYFLSCGNDLLCLSAAKLFFDLFTGESFMFNRSEKALIVLESNSNSWETYTTMVKYATFIDKVGEDEYIRALLRLSQGKGGEEKVKPHLEEFLNNVIITAGVAPGVTGFQPLDETYTSKVGQDIVLTTGVVGILLKYLINFSMTVEDSQKELITRVCKTLIRVTRGNKDVKKMVFTRFDDLLQAKQGVSTIAHLLTEVLTDNIDACHKLPFSTVRKIFNMATTEDLDNIDYLEYIPTLEAWIKVSKSSPQLSKIHQRFVATLFEQYFKGYYDADVTKLKKADDDKFVLLMHMLAVCAEGIHKYCEDVCRNLFDLNTLMGIMVDQDVLLPHRLSFVMMVNEAFLYTEQESLVSVFEFAQTISVWQHVESMILLIEEVHKKLDSSPEEKNTLSEKKKRLVYRIKIRVLFSQHMTHMYWQNHSVQKVNLKSAFNEESVSHGDQIYPLSILYQYLIEGIVPLLSVFADKYAKLWQMYKDELPQPPLSMKNMSVLKKFGHKILELVKKNPDIFVSTKDQQTFWINKLEPILHIDVDGDLRRKKAQDLSFTHSDDITEKDPEQINKETSMFKDYLKNFRMLVYYDNPRTDPQSIYPKGPGFQKLLTCLFHSSAASPISERVRCLGKLLDIIHKKLQQPLDTKEKCQLDELLILILQTLSGVLHERINQGHRDAALIPWQEVFLNAKVHAKCLLHISHPKDEVVLQVLALLTRIALDANECAQNDIYKIICVSDPSFCQTVYRILVKLSNTLSEPAFKNLLIYNNCVCEDVRAASIVLDCISSFCDNQHRNMQNYLRDNKSPYRRPNTVKMIAVLLNLLTAEICKESNRLYLMLMKKAIKALIELITGNFENQQTVFHCQSIHSICNLLKRLAVDDNVRDPNSGECLSESVSNAAIELLKVLIEETHEHCQSIKTFFVDTIDLDAIYESMFKWKNIDAYHILRFVADAQELQAVEYLTLQLPEGHNMLEKTDEKKFLEDFKARSHSIEVLYKPNDSESDILTRVYFEYDPLDKLQNDRKEKVVNAIVDGSIETKLTEFNKWTTGIRQIAKYENGFKRLRVFDPLKLKGHFWLYQIVYGSSYPRHILLIVLTLLLNALVLSSFTIPESSGPMTNNSTNMFAFTPDTTEWYLPLLYVLGILHLFLSCWMVYGFVLEELPNFIANSSIAHTILELWCSLQGWILRFCKPHKMRVKRRKTLFMANINASYFKVNLLGLRSAYIFLFLFCSFAGLLFRGYFYTVCLFYMFVNVDVVEFVIVALHRSAKQLIYVGLIIACILLLFAVISFIFLHDFFEVGKPLFCNSLGECFITVCREGLLGTLGRAIPFTNAVQPVATFKEYSLRTVFFDIPYFIIVSAMSLRIVTAILVNTFNALRNERDRVKKNLMKACFICGLSREKFTKHFSTHIKEHHNMWNYAYFMIYLDRKDRKDMTAIEKQIYDGNPMYSGHPNEEHGQIDHFPIGRAKDKDKGLNN